MQILVKDLIKTCDYKLSYFHKLLRDNNINNRILLDEDDLIKLQNGLKIVGQHSYSLHMSLKKLLNETSIEKGISL